MNKKFISVISILAIVGLAGCDDTSTSLISQTTSTTSQDFSSTIGGFPYNPNLPASVKSYYSVMDYSISDMATLKTDFGALINDHHDVGYDGLKEVYRTSDIKKDGTVWDIYSDTSYSFSGSEAYGDYKEEGDAFNREHTVPQSWFGKVSPMRSDAFHVYPSDGKVNGLRGNNEYGNVVKATYTSTNGCMLGSDERGTTVFEVCDEYKGDIARSYFYMATCYESRAGSWGHSFSNANYTKLSSRCLELMLEWAKNDPVSQKEIDRNNAIYQWQENRNPYIDYPGLDQYIFG